MTPEALDALSAVLGGPYESDDERRVDLLGEALSALGYARSHLKLEPGDLPKILRYLSSEQIRILDKKEALP